MKKIFLFLALISFTIFSACNKQEIVDEVVPTNQEPTASITISKTPNVGHNNILIDAGAANFVINNENKIISENEELLLTDKSLNAVSYQWDFGNGDISTDALPNYKYEAHGYYTVTLTITDSKGDQSTVSDDILVLCVFAGGQHNQ